MSKSCHSYNYLYHEMLDFFSAVENSGTPRSLYLIYGSVYGDLTCGKASICLPKIVKGRNYLNRDHRQIKEKLNL